MSNALKRQQQYVENFDRYVRHTYDNRFPIPDPPTDRMPGFYCSSEDLLKEINEKLTKEVNRILRAGWEDKSIDCKTLKVALDQIVQKHHNAWLKRHKLKESGP